MINNNGKVIYVDPSMIDGVSDYNSTNIGNVRKSVELEDLCVVVELEVEVKGRTRMYSSEGNDQNVINLTWQSSSDGSNISFTKGSRIYTNKERTEYINALTTNYTDYSLMGVKDEGTCEMFGIKSINIDYSNFMIPQVTINFVDVRGVSLFAQEELRHISTRNGINNSIDDSIEGSFFKTFFVFPYPKYTLRVKGFYGEMVSYELSCSDFRASFDSNTGNFNVIAKFVGYAASFLTDVMTNCIVSAPYSEYIGEEYWKNNVQNGRFTIKGENGIGVVKMPRLGEFCKKYDQLQNDVKKQLDSDNVEDEAIKNNVLDEKELEALSSQTISNISNKYKSIIHSLEEIGLKIDTNSFNGETYVRPNQSNSFAFFIDDDDNDNANELKAGGTIFESIKNFNDEIHKDGILKFINESDASQIRNHNFGIIFFEDYNDIVDDSTGEFEDKKIISDELQEAIFEKGKETIANKNKTYHEAWVAPYLHDSFELYVYQDYGLGKIIDAAIEKISSNEKVASDFNQVVESRIITKKASEIFGFRPTVENVTKIIMAHLETYINMISTCSTNIISYGAKRSFSNLNISNTKQFADVGTNSPNSVNQNTIIPPFPKIIGSVNRNNETTEEDEWIGNVKGVNRDYFEEIKLIDGILNGVKKLSNDLIEDNENTENTEETIDYGESLYPMQHPLSYYDLFLKNGDSPFGNVNVSDINDVFGKLTVRAYSLFATQNDSGVDSSYYGMADAENFIKIYGKEKLSNFIGQLIQSITVDDVISAAMGVEKLDKSKSGNAYSNKLLSNYGRYNEDFSLEGNFSGYTQQIYPIKNWDYSILKTKNDNLITKNLSNCVVTTCVEDDVNDVNSITVEYREGGSNYFNNICRNSSNTNIGKETDIVNKIFKNDNSFEFNGLSDEYIQFLVDGEGEKCLGSSINYENGNVSNIGQYLISIPDKLIFTEESDVTKRGENFILEVLKSDTNEFFGTDNLSNAKFEYMAKYDFLYNVVLRDKINGWGDTRKSIVKFYKSKVNNWISNFYKDKIDNYYIFKVDNIKEFRKKLYQRSDNVQVFLDLINSSLSEDDFKKFRSLYSIDVVDGRCVIKPQKTKHMTSIVNDVMKIISLCHVSRFNMKKSAYLKDFMGYSPKVKSHKIKGYFSGILKVFKEQIKNEDTVIESNDVTLNNDSDDLKIELYKYTKLLYDKWISFGEDEYFYTIENLFEGSNPTFHFIDSAYNRVGQVMCLNLSQLVDIIRKCQTTSEFPLISLLSSLYSANRFDLRIINNFMDLSNQEAMERMFKPIPYNECKRPSNHPNFIVTFPYEPSSKLNVDGADHPDDGFYLNQDESMLPEMIKTKNTNIDLPIPAFGVDYGQQYQSYFSNIEVSMDTPVVTEQSIQTKLMIAGAYRNNKSSGPSIVTKGQDLFTLYSNNSYSCTVRMMGCAWVQPLMYFVLNNIPMFGGSYWITNVSHSIEPGSMTTTFKGTRMSKTATKAVKDIAFGFTIDSIGENNNSTTKNVDAENKNASTTNDCKYAYYNPTEEEVNVPTDADAQAYCNATYKILTGTTYNLTPNQAKGICANIYEESGFNPYMVTFDRNTTQYGVSCGLCSCFYYGEAKNMYATLGSIGEQLLNTLNDNVVKIYEQDTSLSLGAIKNKVKNSNLKCEVPFEKQVEFIGISTNKPKYNKIRQTTTEKEAAWAWMVDFERPSEKYRTDRWEKNGSKVESAINGDKKIQINNNEKKDITIDDIANGLRLSVELSLKSTKDNNNTNVKLNRISGNFYEYTTENVNMVNTLFDCMLNTYQDWFSHIEWYVGNGAINDNAKSVRVLVTDKKPASHTISISYGNDGVTVNATSSDDVNNELKVILSKYFKNKKINDANKCKSIFRSCIQIDDSVVADMFDLDGSKQLCEDCNSVIGEYNGIANPVKITPQTVRESNNYNLSQPRKLELFNNNIPKTESEVKKYLDKFEVKTNTTNGTTKTWTIELHKSLKDNFISIIDELNSKGILINNINSYKWRTVPKTGNLSNHSLGIAVDINPGSIVGANTPDNPSNIKNPWFRGYHIELNNQSTWTKGENSVTRVRDYQSEIVETFAKYGWGWGGQYGDTMHFSYAGGK